MIPNLPEIVYKAEKKFSWLKLVRDNSESNMQYVLGHDYLEKILSIYYFQIFHSYKFIIDIDPHYFNYNEEKLYWVPEGRSFQFSAPFINALRNVYQGLFEEEKSQVINGIKGLGVSEAHLDKFYKIIYEYFHCSALSDFDFKKVRLLRLFIPLSWIVIRGGMTLTPDHLGFMAYLKSLHQHIKRSKRPVNLRLVFESARSLQS